MEHDTIITVRKISNGYTVQFHNMPVSDAVFAADVAAVGEAIATTMAAQLLNPPAEKEVTVHGQWGHSMATQHADRADRYAILGAPTAGPAKAQSIFERIKDWK